MMTETTTYKQRMHEAVERTIRLRLDSPITHIMKSILQNPCKPLSKDEYTLHHRHWVGFSREMPVHPEVRANACAMVHPVTIANMYHQGLQDNFPNLVALTIGDVVWEGDTMFEISEDKLERYIINAKQDKQAPFPFHTWITTGDLLMIDLCFASYQCQYNREPMNLMEPNALVTFGKPDAIANNTNMEFRPFLVGAKLLGKTQALEKKAYKDFKRLESLFQTTFFPIR